MCRKCYDRCRRDIHAWRLRLAAERGVLKCAHVLDMDRGEYCSARLQPSDIHPSNLHLCEFHFSEKVAARYKGRKRTLDEQIASGQKFECEYASLPYTTYKRNCMH